MGVVRVLLFIAGIGSMVVGVVLLGMVKAVPFKVQKIGNNKYEAYIPKTPVNNGRTDIYRTQIYAAPGQTITMESDEPFYAYIAGKSMNASLMNEKFWVTIKLSNTDDVPRQIIKTRENYEELGLQAVKTDYVKATVIGVSVQ